jgi:hypothetical protein
MTDIVNEMPISEAISSVVLYVCSHGSVGGDCTVTIAVGGKYPAKRTEAGSRPGGCLMDR